MESFIPATPSIAVPLTLYLPVPEEERLISAADDAVTVMKSATNNAEKFKPVLIVTSFLQVSIALPHGRHPAHYCARNRLHVRSVAASPHYLLQAY